ncbi:hypothetical protein HPB51_022350 [Rhipicephalus microplus]|uniref:Nucleoporin Nup133/Nup155-like C-terminal domain-containing protein n=1 Tax=Rhipicephalus microplus TaxID=6941 RepID=A0A9J6EV58_RHIMP|nr:hypothetical protein HPB51_022350 [Rhipicephalus microplus]
MQPVPGVRPLATTPMVGPQLPLGTACGLLTSCSHYAGVIDLGLSLAKQVDPQGLALHFYQQGERPEDERGRQAYAARIECYKIWNAGTGTLFIAASCMVKSELWLLSFHGPFKLRNKSEDRAIGWLSGIVQETFRPFLPFV